MNKHFFECVRCPISGSRLILDKENNRIITTNGQYAYPIIDGIPILLLEAAEEID